MEISPERLKTIISITLYVILIAFLIFAIYCEQRDINCSKFRGGECGPGMGTVYVDGKYEPGDTKDEILEKIRHTANYETNSITWRRSYIIAAIAAFLILTVTRNKIPTGIDLTRSFIIGYITIYMSFMLFQRWLVRPALNQLDELIRALKGKHA